MTLKISEFSFFSFSSPLRAWFIIKMGLCYAAFLGARTEVNKTRACSTARGLDVRKVKTMIKQVRCGTFSWNFVFGEGAPKESFHIDSTSKTSQGQGNFVRQVFEGKQYCVLVCCEKRLSFEYCEAGKLVISMIALAWEKWSCSGKCLCPFSFIKYHW